MAFWWFILFIFLLVIELLTVNLVTIWFIIGTIFALFTTFITDSFLIQFLVFTIISIISLILMKPFINKFSKNKKIPTNSDRVIGCIGEVVKSIHRNEYGEVKVLNTLWTATSKEEIEKGSRVKVISIEGVKLIVEKEND